MTGEYTYLPRAPILEALIDFRVDPSVGENEESVKLDELKKLLVQGFPEAKEVQQWEAQISVGGDAGPSLQSMGRRRLRLDSTDKLNVIQVDRGGITYSQLKPYVGWAGFSKSFFDTWTHYLSVYKPKQVTQIVLRYINRFEFPNAILDLQEYFLTNPVLGPKIALPFSGYSMQFVLSNEAISANCGVVQVAQPNPGGPGPTVIFDLNAFKQGLFGFDEAVLRKHLEDLHGFKNDVFFGSITEKTMGMYK